MSDRAPRPWKRLLRWVEHVLAAVGLTLIIYHLGFDLDVVVSDSMAPTLAGTSRTNGDWILVEHFSYRLREPRRWELVRFQTEDSSIVIKRAVGLPGERVSMVNQQIHINGQIQPKPPILRKVRYISYGNLAAQQTVECRDGYFVLGDHSADSQDSRFEGPIGPEQLRGRPWCVLWPLTRMRRLNTTD